MGPRLGLSFRNSSGSRARLGDSDSIRSRANTNIVASRYKTTALHATKYLEVAFITHEIPLYRVNYNILRGSHIGLSWFSCRSSFPVELEFGDVDILWRDREKPEKNPRSNATTNSTPHTN